MTRSSSRHSDFSIEVKEFSALVELIYQGAVDVTRWKVILPAIVDWIEARKILFFTPTLSPESGGFLFCHNIAESFIELWRTRYINGDLWVNAGAKSGLLYTGNVQLGHEIVPTEELIASNWYKEFLNCEDIVHNLFGVVFGLESQSLPPVSCSLFRGLHDSEFGVAQRERLRLILPHLSRATGVMLRLQDAEFKVAASIAALERLRTGVVLLNEAGNVVFHNRAANRIFHEQDGLRLINLNCNASIAEIVADGSTNAENSLHEAIRNSIFPDIFATGHFSNSISLLRPSGRAPYVVQFSTLPAENEFGRGKEAPRAIVFINDPENPRTIDHDLLRRTYGLSGAEIRTIEAAMQGGTVENIAQNLGVGENTVRTQLKQVYTKTGCNSRARLVKLIHSLSAT